MKTHPGLKQRRCFPRGPSVTLTRFHGGEHLQKLTQACSFTHVHAAHALRHRGFLTVSAVEQDLDTLPQRVDVLRLPDERIPFFWKKLEVYLSE